jgi:hypothetical protein
MAISSSNNRDGHGSGSADAASTVPYSSNKKPMMIRLNTNMHNNERSSMEREISSTIAMKTATSTRNTGLISSLAGSFGENKAK